MSRRSRLVCAVVALCASAVVSVMGARAAAPGELDPSFGAGGIVTLASEPTVEEARAVALSRDGTVLVAASALSSGKWDAVVVRLRDDGTPDPAFGAGGVARVDVAGKHDFVDAIVEQADGRIVVGGRTNLARGAIDTLHGGRLTPEAFAFIRLLADGRRDPSFGRNGAAIVPVHAFDHYGECPDVSDLALTADGRLVAVGTIGCGGYDGQYQRMVGLSLLADGRLDRSFHGDGLWLSWAGCNANAVHVESDGGLWIAGATRARGPAAGPPVPPCPDAYGKMRLTRLRADGRRATGWAPRGRRVIGFPGFDGAHATDMVVDAQGRMLLVGQAEDRVALARVVADGRLDYGFGNRGRRVLRRFARRSSDHATGVALAADGSVLLSVASMTRTGLDTAVHRFLIARLSPAGVPDPAFGPGGLMQITFGVNNAQAFDVAVDSSDRAVVVGFAADRSPAVSSPFAAARLR